MTPLDRFFQEFPVLKNIVFWLNDHLVIIFVVPFFLFLLFILYWTFILSPRRATKIFQNLSQQGYRPVESDDEQLMSAVEKLAPIMYHTYELSTVKETSPWKVHMACENNFQGAGRFFANIHRTVSRSPRGGGYEVRSEPTIAFFENRALPFTRDIHIAGDHSRLDPGYELSRVGDQSLGPLSSLYVFHTLDGDIDPLPPRLVQALMDCAPFLSISSEQVNKKDPFLFNARIRFTPEGWALISGELVHRQDKMDVMVEVVNLISSSML